ncbi:NrsF family protein [Zavarzinia sp. CC-PAN008]|uniref:NrsF family protein n=1 Tax=Zavarzinia sp. CC-PAN008 TaxID=3243332 RepID=UPI003F74587E
MRTEDLIDRLATGLAPIPALAVERRLALGMAMGGAASILAIVALYGLRADLAQAVTVPSFWLKVLYSLALCLSAGLLMRVLARPDATPGWLPWLPLAPVALMAVLAVLELAASPRADWPRLALGHSWTACPWRVLALSVPIQLGLIWAFRRLAPARPRVAGAAAGLTAGGLAAAIYCLVCTETAATFVVVWYSAGIALSALLGALWGPRLLRW